MKIGSFRNHSNKRNLATDAQKRYIESLAEQYLNVFIDSEMDNIDYEGMTKQQAATLIEKLKKELGDFY